MDLDTHLVHSAIVTRYYGVIKTANLNPGKIRKNRHVTNCDPLNAKGDSFSKLPLQQVFRKSFLACSFIFVKCKKLR